MSRLATTGVVADLLASTQIRLIMAVVGVVRFTRDRHRQGKISHFLLLGDD
jgi:hypothetical protein